jgi:phospholipase C
LYDDNGFVFSGKSSLSFFFITTMHFSIYTSKTALAILACILIIGPFTGCKSSTSTTPAPTGINQVNHVIVFYQENHSFDNLYGMYAGANGLANATAAQWTQVDTAGDTVYNKLPWNDPSFTPTPILPNKYYELDNIINPNVLTEDLVHRWYQEQFQIDGGKMDKFASISTAKGLSLGFYNTPDLPMATQIVPSYVLCDNFYHSAFGGSFLNHQWLITAKTPVWPGAPASVVAVVGKNGYPTIDGICTPGDSIVNTCYTVNNPHPASTPATSLVPNLTNKTIGDELSAANVSWAWYSGGWDNALAGKPDPDFQFHHQPFAFYANYADGTAAKAAHLKDLDSDFLPALAAGTLPAVSFVKFIGEENEHPNYSKLIDADNYLVALINKVKNSPNWKDCVIIVTYDEHGGFWDHVNPPKIDASGPGLRVPTIIISPFAKTGYIDHTQYETVSILSFIEKRWGLSALSSRDAAANPFTNAFTF